MYFAKKWDPTIIYPHIYIDTYREPLFQLLFTWVFLYLHNARYIVCFHSCIGNTAIFGWLCPDFKNSILQINI